jgi:adenylate cyclase
MSDSSASSAKNRHSFFIPLLIFLFAAGMAVFSGLADTWDRALYDELVNIRVNKDRIKLSPFVDPVDLNDKTESLLRERIATRDAFADLINALARCDAIVVMDFLFLHPGSRDAAFINAVKDSGRPVVLAVHALEEQDPRFAFPELTPEEKALMRKNIWHIKVQGRSSVPEAKTLLMPFSGLAEAENVYLGHINVKQDGDGKYRRTNLFYAWEDGFIPSASLAAAVLQLNISPERIVFIPGKELILPIGVDENIRIPVDAAGSMLIPYFETWGDKLHYPMHRIIEAMNDDTLDENYLQALSGGHIALAAEITTSRKDLGSTSFEGNYPLSGIHTTVLSGIMSAAVGSDSSFIGASSLTFKVPSLLVLLLAVILILTVPPAPGIPLRHPEWDFNIRFFVIFTIYSLITYLRWRYFFIAPWYTAGFCGLVSAWIAGFSFRLLHRHQKQMLLHNALTRYFPHALADRIMAEGKTDLAPTYKELTILFSDISGFTKWSSDRQPEDVHRFLSDYLESMAEIVFSHEGTVDKFMGDGMLSFFGDPFEHPQHVLQSTRAAIAMQEKIRLLAAKWKPLVGIDLKVRIGINTGRVVVGNLGTRRRIEYTVIGSAVNLAQRMEGSATPGGILVTRNTWEKARDHFSFSEKKMVTVKGYAEPLEAWELIFPSGPLRG